MWHRLLAPFLALASLFYHPNAYTKMVDRVSSSVVRVTGEMDSPWQGRVHYVCSGEVIAVNHVLTAGHCRGERMLADGAPAAVLKFDEYYDLALLVAETHKPSISMRDYPAQRFEELTAIGYAWGWTRLTALQGRAFIINISPAPMIAPGILTQTQYIGGMSGGTVVDHNGQLVGIVQQSNEGIGYGVGTQLIRAFLLGTE